MPALSRSACNSAIARGNKLPPQDAQEVFVQLEFTVTAEGQVKDAKILDSNTYSRHATEILGRQLSHMVRLVDDLLDISRITRDKLQLRKTRVELAPIIRHAVEASRPLADREQQIPQQEESLDAVVEEPAILAAGEMNDEVGPHM